MELSPETRKAIRDTADSRHGSFSAPGEAAEEVVIETETAYEAFVALCQRYEQDTGRKLTIKVTPRNKVGRNAPCPCGSGRKFKKCCIHKDKAAPAA